MTPEKPKTKNEAVILIFLVIITLAAIAFFAVRLWLPEKNKDKSNEAEENIQDELNVPKISVNELKNMIVSGEQLIILDVQSHEDHLEASLPVTTSIPLDELNARISELPKNKTIIAIDSGEGCQSCVRATEILLTSGYTDVKKLNGGVTAWAEAGYPIAAGKNITFRNISAKDLNDKIFINDTIVIIDVRDKNQYEAGHIKGAKHVAFAGISNNLDDIPRDKQIIVYDQTDNRSQVAVKQLIKEGYLDATNLLDGFAKWQSEGYEVVK